MASRDDMIFLLSHDEVLQKVPIAPYDSEELLQRLIESYPELLVGEQIDQESPPRWLMVSREAGIPDSSGGSARWSVDHLLLDQHARPTFVEVKRSSDTRIRREVVGQMLDYAANGIVHWPADRLRALAADQCGGSGALDERLVELLRLERGPEGEDWRQEIERYWSAVERNLREGTVRLLFVADEIPRELRRIIEFLNEKMATVDVLGVEIRQYRGEGISALVPRVVGFTEAAKDARDGARGPSAVLSKDAYLAAFEGKTREFYRRMLDRAETDDRFVVTWRTRSPSLRILDPQAGKPLTVMYAAPSESGPQLQVYLEYLSLGYPEVVEKIRPRLEALGAVVSGKWQMNFDFGEATLGRAERLLEEVWGWPEMIVHRRAEPNQ